MSAIVTTHYRYKRPPRKRTKAAAIEAPTIVTIRSRKHAQAPDMTPEEHKRRGDAADALFQAMKRRIAEESA